MARSRLQEPFMREVSLAFAATAARIERRLAQASAAEAKAVIDDELRGLYHGLFVILDGGSALADEGLLRLADEDGVPFDRFLHEICFRYWPPREKTEEPGLGPDLGGM